MRISPDTLLKEIAGADIAVTGVLARFGILPGYGNETLGEGACRVSADIDLLVLILNLFFDRQILHEGHRAFKRIGDMVAVERFLRETNDYYLQVQLPIIGRHLAHLGLRSEILSSYMRDLARLFQNRTELYARHLYPVIRGRYRLDENEETEFEICDREVESRIADLKNFFLVHLSPPANPGMILGVLATVDALLKDFSATMRLASILTRCEKGTSKEREETDGTDGSSSISPREREVLILLAGGLSNKEVADRLNISINTAITHRRNITTKLGIRSLAGLSLYAYTHGMLETK